jgi:hypothetical protein
MSEQSKKVDQIARASRQTLQDEVRDVEIGCLRQIRREESRG